jgi:NTE family protein
LVEARPSEVLMADLRADLVLEGGGVKGIALVGAISVLEERGYSFHRVAGTSAGAIVGALVAAGFSAPELHSIMQAVEYPKFQDGGPLDHAGLFGKAIELVFEHGIYKGEYLKSWLHEQLRTKRVEKFGDLHLDPPDPVLGADRQERLVVMASDISDGVLRRLPWDYPAFGLAADGVRVVDAVRASMSIPFFYQPVKLENAKREACWFVDGGMLSNFPIDVFDRTDGKPPRWPTFGIKLSARPDAAQGVVNDVHGAITMTKAMLETMTSFYDRMHIDEPGVIARTIFIDTMKVRATDFGIDDETKTRLYENGRAAATAFLDGGPGSPAWNFQEYIAKYRTA